MAPHHCSTTNLEIAALVNTFHLRTPLRRKFFNKTQPQNERQAAGVARKVFLGERKKDPLLFLGRVAERAIVQVYKWAGSMGFLKLFVPFFVHLTGSLSRGPQVDQRRGWGRAQRSVGRSSTENATPGEAAATLTHLSDFRLTFVEMPLLNPQTSRGGRCSRFVTARPLVDDNLH